MFLRHQKRLDYLALHSGSNKASDSMAELNPEEDVDIFHDSFNDPTDVKKAEADALESELEALAVEERLTMLKQKIKQKKENIANLVSSNSSNNEPALQPSPRSTPQTQPATLKSLAADQELNAALEVLKEAHLTNLLTDDLTLTSQGAVSNDTGKFNDKVLYITDFVIKPKSSGRESEKEIAKNLWVRFNKMKAEEVTVPQWVSANARILLNMLDNLDKDAVRRYLRYTAKVGDYLQISDAASVMLFDEEHRRQVAREGQRWDEIDGDTRYFYLEKENDDTAKANKQQSQKPQNNQARKKPRGPVDETGTPICLRYNQERGCTSTWCTFAHVCSLAGCQAAHPRHLHNAPPRFLNQKQ